MAEQESKTAASDEQTTAQKAGGAESEGVENDGATEQAARRPVRKASGKPRGGPNKGKPGKANQQNRSARAVREKGANKAASASDPDKDEEEEEDEEKRSANDFWQLMVAGSYSSRKARGDWGGGEDGE